MEKKKEAIAATLVKGLPKTQANRLASFIVEFYNSVDENKEQLVVRQRSKSVTALTSDDIQLAQTLRAKIKKFIESTGYNYKIPDEVELGNAISLLHRLDKKEYKEISTLISYLYEYYQPNSSFDWRMQVRSGVAFRRHYEKIMVSASQDYAYLRSRQIEDVK